MIIKVFFLFGNVHCYVLVIYCSHFPFIFIFSSSFQPDRQADSPSFLPCLFYLNTRISIHLFPLSLSRQYRLLIFRFPSQVLCLLFICLSPYSLFLSMHLYVSIFLLSFFFFLHYFLLPTPSFPPSLFVSIFLFFSPSFPLLLLFPFLLPLQLPLSLPFSLPPPLYLSSSYQPE